MACCGDTTAMPCSCVTRASLTGAMQAVIYTTPASMRAIVGLVRVVNTADTDETFSLAVVCGGDGADDATIKDWLVHDAPILAGERVDAVRSIILACGQSIVAAASSGAVAFGVSKMERAS